MLLKYYPRLCFVSMDNFIHACGFNEQFYVTDFKIPTSHSQLSAEFQFLLGTCIRIPFIHIFRSGCQKLNSSFLPPHPPLPISQTRSSSAFLIWINVTTVLPIYLGQKEM